MVSDRRGRLRLHVVWKAMLTRLNGEQLTGSTDDVSDRGMNIIVAKPLVIGEPVRVNVVSRCSGRLSCYGFDAVVVYNRSLDANLGTAVGLRLLDPSQQYIDFLSASAVALGSQQAS